jgi:FkbM family methyltransferase
MPQQQGVFYKFVTSHFPRDFKGVYVDVGAGYPESFSNSFQFRSLGWKIIAIEPQPNMCDAFRAKGYPIIQYACSDKDEGEVDFEVCGYAGGLGGSAFKVLDPQSRINYEITPIKVKAYTLTTILSDIHSEVEHIDVLDIDVEYSELKVLQGLDFEKYDPTVMSVENLPWNDVWHNPYIKELREFCISKGYKLVNTIEYNEYWIKK